MLMYNDKFIRHCDCSFYNGYTQTVFRYNKTTRYSAHQTINDIYCMMAEASLK